MMLNWYFIDQYWPDYSYLVYFVQCAAHEKSLVLVITGKLVKSFLSICLQNSIESVSIGDAAEVKKHLRLDPFRPIKENHVRSSSDTFSSPTYFLRWKRL